MRGRSPPHRGRTSPLRALANVPLFIEGNAKDSFLINSLHSAADAPGSVQPSKQSGKGGERERWRLKRERWRQNREVETEERKGTPQVTQTLECPLLIKLASNTSNLLLSHSFSVYRSFFYSSLNLSFYIFSADHSHSHTLSLLTYLHLFSLCLSHFLSISLSLSLSLCLTFTPYLSLSTPSPLYCHSHGYVSG